MGQRIPAEVFPPGEVIQEELAARGWSLADLARLMRRPAGPVREIIDSTRAITLASARELGAAFGTGAVFWMNMQRSYDRAPHRKTG